MSAFVLNRNYELKLPNSFVDVDCNEMEYVEGGAFYVEDLANTLGDLPKTQYWWGTAWDLSSEMCTKVGDKFADASYEIGAGAILVTAAAAKFAGVGLYFGVVGAITGYAFYRIGTQLRDASGGATLSFNASAFHVNPW